MLQAGATTVMEQAVSDHSEVERLRDAWNEIAYVCQIIGICCYSIITLAVYVLFVTIMAQKTFKELPFKVKVSLLIYLAYAPGTLTLMVMIMLNDRDWGLIIYLDLEWRALAAIAYTLWMSLHCQFTAHYL